MSSKLMWVVLAGVLATTVAHASPARTGKVDVGINVSAAFQEDVETAAFVEGKLSYGVNEWFGVGFSGGFMEADFDSVGSFQNIGSLSAVPLFGDFYFRARNDESPWVGYGVIGFGGIIWDVDEGADLAGASVDIDSSFGVKLGGGVDYFVNENWAINFEGAYVFSDAESTIRTSTVSVTEDVDTDYWYVGGGVKYLFS